MKHAKERAWERYNRHLDTKEILQIVNSIKNKEYLYIGNSERDEKKHFVYVKHKNIPYKVLYVGEKHPNIITIYPIDVDEYNALVEERRIDKYVKYLMDRGYEVRKCKHI